jgi:hypothetical protein
MAATQALQGAADDIAGKILATTSLPGRSGAQVPRTSSKAEPHNGPSTTFEANRGRLPDVVTLKVGRVDGNRVCITGGENVGLKVNDYFEVRHVTGTIEDDHGNDIETDERIETVVVTDVQEKFAVAKSTRAGAPAARVGDQLKRVRAPTTPPKSVGRLAPGSRLAPIEKKT